MAGRRASITKDYGGAASSSTLAAEGDTLMVDAAHLAMDPGSVSVTQSRTVWGLEIGRHQMRVTRTREARTLRAPESRTSRPRGTAGQGWPLAIGTFASVSAFGLFVFGAVASEPSLPRRDVRYSLSVPVPARVAPDRRSSNRRRVKVLVPSTNAHSIDMVLSGARFDVADEPYVAKAMRAGDFQEWSDAEGERHFLNVGPEQVDDNGRCRDLVLLVRRKDGSSQTRNARRCVMDRVGQAAGNTAAGIGQLDVPYLSQEPDVAAASAAHPDGEAPLVN